MNVIFFPKNALNATLCPIFNGHKAIVCHNTDRIKDGKFALAELNLFRHNIQGTSFLNPEGDGVNAENANYGQLIKDVLNSGRISLGIYWRTDWWVNPTTGKYEPIPDYNAEKWSATGAAAFADAVQDATKVKRFPDHGQEMFDISRGAFGYDFINAVAGASNMSETYELHQHMIDHFKELAGLSVSVGSYTNGANQGANLLLPVMLGMRNSSHSYQSNGDIRYSGLTRAELINRASTTRTWDAPRATPPQFPDQATSVSYSQSEIRRAIQAGGRYSDFMHWHSLYEIAPYDYGFFNTLYKAMNEAIGIDDVWRAGDTEATEYYVMRESVERIGSFIHDRALYITVRFKDAWFGTTTQGISNNLNLQLIKTPISIQVDLAGTPLAGVMIGSEQAHSVRNLGNDVWILNLNPISGSFHNGYLSFKITQVMSLDHIYDAGLPVLSTTSNLITSNKPAKFVVWRIADGANESTLTAVHRTTEFSTTLQYPFQSGFSYFVGANTRSRVSSAIDI